MAIGKRKPQQKSMWISEHQLPKEKGHPFYSRLNKFLEKDGFDSWVKELCAPCFAAKGRPSIPPGVYFRMLFIGYLEGFASDRAAFQRIPPRIRQATDARGQGGSD